MKLFTSNIQEGVEPGTLLKWAKSWIGLLLCHQKLQISNGCTFKSENIYLKDTHFLALNVLDLNMMLLKWNLPNKVSKYGADILPELYTPPSMGMVIHFGGKMLIFYSCKKKSVFFSNFRLKKESNKSLFYLSPKTFTDPRWRFRVIP